MNQPIKPFIGERWVEFHFRKPTKRNRYFVSNYGRVKAVDKRNDQAYLVNGTLDNRGLRKVNVRLTEGFQNIFPHKFVAERFIECPSPEHTYVLHKDYDKLNNQWTNLYWATKEEWIKYVDEREKALGIVRRKNSGIKLTETQVSLIKKWLLAGKTKKKVIAKKFGVTETQISRIEKGENWGDIKPAK
ncbi:MAG: hypothetical protein AAF990_22445 [Bacteroidota bacterium]